ncbi:hypothetical protein SAY87_031399 [Trapa incisa]|uniref:protein-serine/threonine phosphatase n=1 Tax=Trapa incisa TaxID=236973 RepID=A0AAN7QKU5_9MYRT|nr:hypothetical protein SAY87_031399 [Trapa incisa]
MVLSPTMVTEAEVSMQYRLRVSKEPAVVHQIDVASSTILHEVRVADSVSTEFTRFDSVSSYSENVQEAITGTSKSKYLPSIRSGSYSDIGSRMSMEDEHIRIDDLSSHPVSLNFCTPGAFYAVFDGHGGPEAATYVKRNAMRLFFEDTLLPDALEFDNLFQKRLEDSHREAFLQADHALANEPTVSSSCGTTALTALILGRHLLVANAGDCRAVLCRRGTAIEMSQDHRPSYAPEQKRVLESGGFVLDGYLNGCLSITRALGDWDMKLPLGSCSPLIAEPDFRWATLCEEDEFLIIACDGLWDVMSSQYAVSLVRQGLRRHNDPQQCARELVMDALRLKTSDNVTVLVVCLSTPEPYPPLRRRLRCFNISEEARNRLRNFLGGN